MENIKKTNVDEHISQALDQDGFYHLKSCVDPALTNAIKLDFVRVLLQYSKKGLALPTTAEGIDNLLDSLFAEITVRSTQLRENAYKVFTENIKIINIANQKKISSALQQLDLVVPTLCGFNVLAMEPNRKGFLFHPHQDLHHHISHKTINIWVPLTTDKNIGGIGIVKGAHADGPLPHFVAPDGHLEIKRSFFEHREHVLFEDVDVGDAIIFDTQAIHWSIMNRSKKTRWTVQLALADGARTPHLESSHLAFDPSNYIDVRSNEDRIKTAHEPTE